MRLLLPVPLGPSRTLRTYALVLVGLVVVCLLWEKEPDDPVGVNAPGSAHKLIELASATAICSAHGWQPFKPLAGVPRKVYDLCMVNTELDWLEIRLNTTYDEVDYFVIVEAPKTFTGLDKPLSIRDNWDRFAPYHAKMLYRELQYPADFNPQRAWDREDLQRNALFSQVLAPDATMNAGEGADKMPVDAVPHLGDVLVVADVDEIPRPSTLRTLRLCDFPRRLTLSSQFYYYSFQFRHQGHEWAHPQATIYDGPAGTVLPVHLRNGDGGRGGDASSFLGRIAQLIITPFTALRRRWDKADMPNAGWHCSSCYSTMHELLHKLESVSHVWMNHDFFRNRERAAHHVRNGIDLFDRSSEVYEHVINNADIPSLLLQQPDRFRYLINRDGESAGFSDYP
ncbi:hypothetical protein SEPCBS119000_003330 [Sporothrix epigloea]|uniref:Glycosyl transferase family 17 protein n=1 Tax=Sporothrix epigloea TaxID=1892477 RepID=A0ABP0DL47_9PEZI